MVSCWGYRLEKYVRLARSRIRLLTSTLAKAIANRATRIRTDRCLHISWEDSPHTEWCRPADAGTTRDVPLHKDGPGSIDKRDRAQSRYPSALPIEPDAGSLSECQGPDARLCVRLLFLRLPTGFRVLPDTIDVNCSCPCEKPHRWDESEESTAHRNPFLRSPVTLLRNL